MCSKKEDDEKKENHDIDDPELFQLPFSEDSITIVKTSKKLLEVLPLLYKSDFIGMDIEWETAGNGMVERPALIQLGVLDHVYLIDMVELGDDYYKSKEVQMEFAGFFYPSLSIAHAPESGVQSASEKVNFGFVIYFETNDKVSSRKEDKKEVNMNLKRFKVSLKVKKINKHIILGYSISNDLKVLKQAFPLIMKNTKHVLSSELFLDLQKMASKVC